MNTFYKIAISFCFSVASVLMWIPCHGQKKSVQLTDTLISYKKTADVKIGAQWYKDSWTISPEIPADTFTVNIFQKHEDIVFRTDVDGISFKLTANGSRTFFVETKEGRVAKTVFVGVPYLWQHITYSVSENNSVPLYFENFTSPYLDTLRRAFPIGKLIKATNSDSKNVLSVMNWVHNRWKHDGGNAPKGSTGLSILNEALKGGRFPCFAYAAVLRDQLLSAGFAARVLYLKTKDAATRSSSPGHVVTEVYLSDIKKWVFLDPQFNIMPVLKGKPLNAVEFQHALSNQYSAVEMRSLGQVSKSDYTAFVYDYLYYFDTLIDNRFINKNSKVKLNGKPSLMLKPKDAPDLKQVSYWNLNIDYCAYTENLNDFYSKPELN